MGSGRCTFNLGPPSPSPSRPSSRSALSLRCPALPCSALPCAALPLCHSATPPSSPLLALSHSARCTLAVAAPLDAETEGGPPSLRPTHTHTLHTHSPLAVLSSPPAPHEDRLFSNKSSSPPLLSLLPPPPPPPPRPFFSPLSFFIPSSPSALAKQQPPTAKPPPPPSPELQAR